MILEFKIRNFLSFKDEVTFSFEATADKSYEDHYVTEITPGVRILKLGIVYGANASGKSNLIEALDFIRRIIRLKRNDKTEGTGFIPFLFGDTAHQPGQFELTFYIEKTRFIYKLTLDKEKITEEKLDYYPGAQPANLFHRTYNTKNDASEIEFGSKVKINKIAKDEISAKLLKNVSFFVGYNQVNYTHAEIDRAFEISLSVFCIMHNTISLI
jgi:AAA15 family ATPase/GTPase